MNGLLNPSESMFWTDEEKKWERKKRVNIKETCARQTETLQSLEYKRVRPVQSVKRTCSGTRQESELVGIFYFLCLSVRSVNLTFVDKWLVKVLGKGRGVCCFTIETRIVYRTRESKFKKGWVGIIYSIINGF